MNNVDVIILIIMGISALIALNRGLVKEVLSIIGWVFAIIAIIYLLPIFEPVIEEYVVGGWMSSVVTAALILIVFMLLWYFATTGLIKDIRNSKLSTADRILGLFFGIARAFLLVVLFNIMIGWMMPEKTQPKVLQDSKYFQLAGKFAKPLEEMLPEETLVDIKEKARTWGEKRSEGEGEEEEKEVSEPKKSEPAKKAYKRPGDDAEELFDKLARPQIKKASERLKNDSGKGKAEEDGYNNHERANLDRLIENTIE